MKGGESLAGAQVFLHFIKFYLLVSPDLNDLSDHVYSPFVVRQNRRVLKLVNVIQPDLLNGDLAKEEHDVPEIVASCTSGIISFTSFNGGFLVDLSISQSLFIRIFLMWILPETDWTKYLWVA
jgi:hypothetical protein